MYDTTAEFALKDRLLPALAFIPVPNVIETFEFLAENELWIRRPYRRSHRRAPLFEHEMWICFDTVVEGMWKRNNATEGWHKSFQHEMGARHPSIWKFIDGLKREQGLKELRVGQHVGGS